MNSARIVRRFFTICIIITGYFALVFLLYFLHIDTVMIGILREMLTIPFFLAQIVFLVLGVIMLIRKETPDKRFVIAGTALLIVSTALTIGSFLSI
ncbi:MAG: hypothetical protein GXO47_08275 [Chlorobi bacterium]|nr:hypothetical protein [Chlorobiota bacterium]